MNHSIFLNKYRELEDDAPEIETLKELATLKIVEEEIQQIKGLVEEKLNPMI